MGVPKDVPYLVIDEVKGKTGRRKRNFLANITLELTGAAIPRPHYDSDIF
jgi:hypothetical protein